MSRTENRHFYLCFVFVSFKSNLKMSSVARIGKPAPQFTAAAVVGSEIKKVSLSDYKGKYVVLVFYPLGMLQLF
jgi:hypothetical protein